MLRSEQHKNERHRVCEPSNDAEDECDFHFMSESTCYLGNFNTETPIPTPPSGTYPTYIFKGKTNIQQYLQFC